MTRRSRITKPAPTAASGGSSPQRSRRRRSPSGTLPGAAQAAPAAELALKPTATGYALVSPAGRVAEPLGRPRACRERCLRRALQLGVIRLK